MENIENAIRLLKDNGYRVIKLPDDTKEYVDIFFELIKLLKCNIKDANITYFEEQPYFFKLKLWFPHKSPNI